jgi:protein phosphatase
MAALVQAANHGVYDEIDRRPSLAEMGATVVAAVPSGNGWVVGHVGDARAYAVTDGLAVCLTEDDRYPNGSLTQSLGGLPERDDIVVHTATHGYETHNRILLCSDGLFDAIAFAELQEALAQLDDREAVEALLKACLAAGAPDNVTIALLARTGEDEG